MVSKNNSPYTSSFTSCVYLQSEFDRALHLFLSDNAEILIKQEIEANSLLMLNSRSTRTHAVNEIRKRFNACSRVYWEHYQGLTGDARRLAYFYAILKAYRLLFDLHINVTVRRWQSAQNTVGSDDLRLEFNEIAGRDSFVASWTELTQKKVFTAYMSIMRKVGLLSGSPEVLNPVSRSVEDFRFYLENGESWFLEACLLQKYEITNMRSLL